MINGTKKQHYCNIHSDKCAVVLVVYPIMWGCRDVDGFGVKLFYVVYLADRRCPSVCWEDPYTHAYQKGLTAVGVSGHDPNTY